MTKPTMAQIEGLPAEVAKVATLQSNQPGAVQTVTNTDFLTIDLSSYVVGGLLDVEIVLLGCSPGATGKGLYMQTSSDGGVSWVANNYYGDFHYAEGSNAVSAKYSAAASIQVSGSVSTADTQHSLSGAYRITCDSAGRTDVYGNALTYSGMAQYSLDIAGRGYSSSGTNAVRFYFGATTTRDTTVASASYYVKNNLRAN